MYGEAVFFRIQKLTTDKTFTTNCSFRFSTDPGDTIEMDDMDIFTLPDLEQYNVRIMFTGKENFKKKKKKNNPLLFQNFGGITIFKKESI